MKISFPSVIATNQINNFFIEIQKIVVKTEPIILDTTTLKYIETTGVNYFLLVPFYLKSNNTNIKIKVNSKQETYKFVKRSGVFDILSNYFEIFEDDQDEKTNVDNNLKSIIESNQLQMFNALSSEPLFRTHIAKNEQDRQILKLLAKEYKYYIEKSVNNEQKISTCITELIYNIFDHSEQNIGAISIHFYSENKQPYMYISVTDLGIGFKNSLLKSSKFQDKIKYPDSFFLKSAIEFQTTSTDKIGRGLGLYYVSKNCDNLTIKSGFGNLLLSNDSNKPRFEFRDDKSNLIGANIICVLKIDI